MDATMENKMGLPAYEEMPERQAPPPSYFESYPPRAITIIHPGPPRPSAPVSQQPATTARTTVIGPQKMGPGPTGAQCPNCNKQIVTRVEYTANNRTHIISAALCVLAGCCCACFIPYCMRSCKTGNHYCPQCQAFVGSYIPS